MHINKLNETNQKQILEFLFKYLEKHGKKASVLFSNINLENIRMDAFSRLINDYSDTFDFNMINSKTLIQSSSNILNEIAKVRFEFSEKMKKMEECLKVKETENQKLTNQISEIVNHMKEQDEKMDKLMEKNAEYERRIQQLEQQLESDINKEIKEVEESESTVINESIKGKIIKANGLPKCDYDQVFYVLLTVLSNGKKDHNKGKIKTNVFHDSTDLFWNFDFAFANVNKSNSLKAEIFSCHKVLGDMCIGFVEIPLNDLKENQPIETTFTIQKPLKVPKIIKRITDLGNLTLSLEYNVESK